ncbi:quaternary ammonium transporter [Bacillus sp. FJAT-27264]|uniref:DMT family transporter n=1 Tax=Paenibacillus sp. (strain DSM 101736 / FJAT-27264) TaxID=1850362 RepID=UPI0008080108|nr:multidrug efflux SMR transporter [Bacillus sp. FJAT-27264]OBZ14096.1 quaternary ammonium transporter [Bacillus sp. FJAT-27264]
MGYLYLALSIVFELFGTSMLKASQGFSKPLPVIGVVVGFVVAFFFLSLTLKTIPLNAAYAIWSGVGSVATVIISVLIWKEKISTGSLVGIALIVIGVVVLNLFGPGHGDSTNSAQTEVVSAK